MANQTILENVYLFYKRMINNPFHDDSYIMGKVVDLYQDILTRNPRKEGNRIPLWDSLDHGRTGNLKHWADLTWHGKEPTNEDFALLKRAYERDFPFLCRQKEFDDKSYNEAFI